MARLLDNMPSIHDNSNSMHGPILACDRGYGKKSFIEMLGAKHYKVVTIASPIGSDHPIVSSTTVSAYVEKLKAAGITNCLNLDDNSDEEATDELSDVLDRNVNSFLLSLEDYTLHDDPNQLLGPEVIVAQHSQHLNFFAIGIRDIFDKKCYVFTSLDFPRSTLY